MTTIFFDKRGKLSVVKTSLFFVGLGLLFAFGSFVFVAIETEASRSPLHVPIPESAEAWGEVQTSQRRAYQEAYYKIQTTEVEAVVEHYQQQADQFGSESCKRFPPSGNFLDYEPDEPGLIPYKWDCLFERANVPGVSQTTQVTIHPGIPNEDPFLDTQGFTVIRYEQRWQK